MGLIYCGELNGMLLKRQWMKFVSSKRELLVLHVVFISSPFDFALSQQQSKQTIRQIVLLPTIVVTSQAEKTRNIRITHTSYVRACEVNDRVLEQLQTKLSFLN